jgi:hypothetical protein
MAQFFIILCKCRKQRGRKRVVLTKYSSQILEAPKCFNFIYQASPRPSPGERENKDRV